MFNLHRLISSTMLLMSMVRPLAALPIAMTSSAVNAASPSVPFTLTLDTNNASAVSVDTQPVPNYDTEVLSPLRAYQAKAAAEAATAKQRAAQEEAAKVSAVRAQQQARQPVAAVPNASSSDMLLKLRLCEAGGIYTRNSGNGYYGAYQYNIGSWGNYGGYARADLAPAAVQDAKVSADISTRGWSPWPSCARRIGAM